MAMRRIRNEMMIPLKPKKGFHITIPINLLHYDPPEEQEKLLGLWRQFSLAANNSCEARYNFLTNKRLRRAAFKAQMDRLCKDFSRRTENLKVVFQTIPRQPNSTRGGNKNKNKNNNNIKEDYQLRFLYLTDIPESARNAPYVTADIPQPTAFGTYDTEFQLVVEQISGREEEALATDIPTAPITILDGPNSGSSERSASTTTTYTSEDTTFDNPPMATSTVVAAVVEQHARNFDETDDDAPVLAIARLDS